MDKKNQNRIVVIEAKEYYGDKCLNDLFNSQQSFDRRPRGEVHIFEFKDNKQKKLLYKNNLVVYDARETIIQQILNMNNPNFSGDDTKPTKDCFLCWFGLGEGGVQAGDPLTPIPPIITNNYLNSPVPISDSTSSVHADFHYVGETRPDGWTYSTTGSYKKQFDVGGVNFEQDELNDNKYLVAKISTTIDSDEANGFLISEAGLFTAESSIGGYIGPFILYARITFPTIVKTPEGRLRFSWYLYF